MKMFKKILLALLIAVSGLAHAQNPKTFLCFGLFSLAVDRVNWTRLMLDKANTTQTKYNFVLMQAQGAAGGCCRQTHTIR
jgi:hypothetical protein